MLTVDLGCTITRQHRQTRVAVFLVLDLRRIFECAECVKMIRGCRCIDAALRRERGSECRLRTTEHKTKRELGTGSSVVLERKLTLSTEALPAALAASAPLSFLICSSVPVRARFQARLTHKRPQMRCIADHRERPRSAGLPRAAHLAFSPSGYLVGLPANAHRGICQSTLHESVPRLLDAHLYFCPKFAFRVENLEVRQGGGQRLGRSSSLHPRVLKKFRCVQPRGQPGDPRQLGQEMGANRLSVSPMQFDSATYSQARWPPN